MGKHKGIKSGGSSKGIDIKELPVNKNAFNNPNFILNPKQALTSPALDYNEEKVLNKSHHLSQIKKELRNDENVSDVEWCNILEKCESKRENEPGTRVAGKSNIQKEELGERMQSSNEILFLDCSINETQGKDANSQSTSKDGDSLSDEPVTTPSNCKIFNSKKTQSLVKIKEQGSIAKSKNKTESKNQFKKAIESLKLVTSNKKRQPKKEKWQEVKCNKKNVDHCSFGKHEDESPSDTNAEYPIKKQPSTIEILDERNDSITPFADKTIEKLDERNDAITLLADKRCRGRPKKKRPTEESINDTIEAVQL